MLADEPESASILPLIPLIRTWTVSALPDWGLLGCNWKTKSESDELSCARWTDLVPFGLSVPFCLPLHTLAKWPFSEQAVHVFLEAGHLDHGPSWSNPQYWHMFPLSSFCLRGAFFLYRCPLEFWGLLSCTLFTGTVLKVSTFSMSCACLLMSSLFAACSKSCWRVYLLTMASLCNFLSLMVCRILLRIASSGSEKLHLATWSRNLTWYWATDSPFT